MNPVFSTLLRLIRDALNEEGLPRSVLLRSADTAEPSGAADWEAVLQEARAQTVLGLVFPALPAEAMAALPPASAAALKTEVFQLKAKFMRILYGQTRLVSLFQAAGIPLVILKGMAAAMYYPTPERRAMGDVDFLVPPERFADALRLMERSGYARRPEKADEAPVQASGIMPDAAPAGSGPPGRPEPDPADDSPRHVQFFRDGVEYELHHHFSSFGLDLEPILLDAFDRPVTRGIAGRAFPTLPNPENALVLLAHIRQHLLESGLGLRQIIDWMQCLKNLSAEETARLQTYARQTGLDTLAGAINRICNQYLGTAFSWTADVDPMTVEALLEHLFERGNFGRKLGTDRPVEAVSLSIREQGLFPYLQSMGLLHWEAARRHAFLRPFAWMHTVCRYGKKGTKLLFHAPGSVQAQLSGGMKINELLRRLDLD